MFSFIAIVLVVVVVAFIVVSHKRSAALEEQLWALADEAESDAFQRECVESDRLWEEEQDRLEAEAYAREQRAEEEEEWKEKIRLARRRAMTPEELAEEAEIEYELRHIHREWVARGKNWDQPLPEGWV